MESLLALGLPRLVGMYPRQQYRFPKRWRRGRNLLVFEHITFLIRSIGLTRGRNFVLLTIEQYHIHLLPCHRFFGPFLKIFPFPDRALVDRNERGRLLAIRITKVLFNLPVVSRPESSTPGTLERFQMDPEYMSSAHRVSNWHERGEDSGAQT